MLCCAVPCCAVLRAVGQALPMAVCERMSDVSLPLLPSCLSAAVLVPMLQYYGYTNKD